MLRSPSCAVIFISAGLGISSLTNSTARRGTRNSYHSYSWFVEWALRAQWHCDENEDARVSEAVLPVLTPSRNQSSSLLENVIRNMSSEEYRFGFLPYVRHEKGYCVLLLILALALAESPVGFYWD